MTVTFWLVVIPTICYTLASGLYFWKGDVPLGITYSGYAWANVGLLWIDFLRRQGS